MIKIFLSPSNETKNIGAYKSFNTNECEQAEKIAQSVKKHLEDYDCEVMIGERADDMRTRITKAQVWGETVHIPIHTNAYALASVWGVETFYHSSDAVGKELATALLNAIGGLIGKKRKAKVRDNLIETNTPTCTRAYVECDFHTNPSRAAYIVENTDKFGETIANVLIKFYDLKLKPKVSKLYTISIADLCDEEIAILKASYPLATVIEQEMVTDSIKVTEDEISLTKGDKIKLVDGANVYNEVYEFSDWVYKITHYVKSINGDRVAFTKNADLSGTTGVVHIDDIIKIKE